MNSTEKEKIKAILKRYNTLLLKLLIDETASVEERGFIEKFSNFILEQVGHQDSLELFLIECESLKEQK